MPPYRGERPLVAGAGEALPRGSVIVVDAVPLPADDHELREELGRLRMRYRGAALMVRISSSFDDLLEISTRGVPPCVRGVLLRGRPLEPALRRQLTNPAPLADGVVDWLGSRGIRMSPALADLVRQIFTRAPRHKELSHLCRAAGVVESSARFRFGKKGLPSPSRWLHAARGIHAVLRLQADPGSSLLAHALALGYADHSALSHQIRRTFGVRPGDVREALGWEWLLDRWLDRTRDGGS